MGLGTRGNTGIKVILFMGIGTFLFLMLVAYGLRQSFTPQERLRVAPGEAQSPFQEVRAWADLEALVALGPRPSGSPAMEAQRRFVGQRLRAAGVRVRTFPFDAETPQGPVAMENVAGIVEGTMPGVVALMSHFDTFQAPGVASPGANDGASGTALLLELARVLGPRREGRSVWLMFVDGRAAPDAEGEAGGLYGSRHLVASLRDSGELRSIRTAVDVNLIGDCYLSVFKDGGAPDWIRDIVWNTAGRRGYGRHFGRQVTLSRGDHTPFREAGIPAISLSDYSYGGGRLDHGRNWRTGNDTLEKVCPGSLRAVGDVIYHALPVIEGQLDTMSARSDGH